MFAKSQVKVGDCTGLNEAVTRSIMTLRVQELALASRSL